jgi:hypothetical protein
MFRPAPTPQAPSALNRLIAVTLSLSLVFLQTPPALAGSRYDDPLYLQTSNTPRYQEYQAPQRNQPNVAPRDHIDRQIEFGNALINFRKMGFPGERDYNPLKPQPAYQPPAPPTPTILLAQVPVANKALDFKPNILDLRPPETPVAKSTMARLVEKAKDMLGFGKNAAKDPKPYQIVAQRMTNVTEVQPNVFQAKGGSTFILNKEWQTGSTFRVIGENIELLQGTSLEPAFGPIKRTDGGMIPVFYMGQGTAIKPTGIDFTKLAPLTGFEINGNLPIHGFGTITGGKMTYDPVEVQRPNGGDSGLSSPSPTAPLQFQGTKLALENPAQHYSGKEPYDLTRAKFTLEGAILRLKEADLKQGDTPYLFTDKGTLEPMAPVAKALEEVQTKAAQSIPQTQKTLNDTLHNYQAVNALLGPPQTRPGDKDGFKETLGTLKKTTAQLTGDITRATVNATQTDYGAVNESLPAIQQTHAQIETQTTDLQKTSQTLGGLARSIRNIQTTDGPDNAQAVADAVTSFQDLTKSGAFGDKQLATWGKNLKKIYTNRLADLSKPEGRGFIHSTVQGLSHASQRFLAAALLPVGAVLGVMRKILPVMDKALNKTWMGEKLTAGYLFSVLSGDAFAPRTRISFDPQGPRVVTINGVFNKRKNAEAINTFTRRAFGVKYATRVENPTTYVGDILQIIGHEYLGAVDRSARETARAIRVGIKEDGLVFVVAHSQGTAIFHQSLTLLTKEERAKVHYLGVGSEWFIDAESNGLAGARNVWNEGDRVPGAGAKFRPTNLLFPSHWNRSSKNWTRVDADANRFQTGNHHSFFDYYCVSVNAWAKEMKLLWADRSSNP